MRCLRQPGCTPCFSLMIKMWVKVKKTMSKSVLCKWQLYTTPNYLSHNILLADFRWGPSTCLKICVGEMLTLRQGETVQALHPIAGLGCLLLCLCTPCFLVFPFQPVTHFISLKHGKQWVSNKSCTLLLEKSNMSICWKTYFCDKGKDCIKSLIPIKSS